MQLNNLQQMSHRKIPSKLLYTVLYFVFLLIVLSIFRLVFLLNNLEQLTPENSDFLMLSFFNRGILFDTIASVYVLGLPIIILITLYLTNTYKPKFLLIIHRITVAFAILTVIISISDLPFYKYYNARINKSILLWTDDASSMLKMMFTDPSYLTSYLLIILFTFLIVFFSRWIFRISLKQDSNSIKHPIYIRIPIFLILLFGLFIGFRGDHSFRRMPTMIEHAYITPHPFINLMSINAFHSFVNSFGDESFNSISDKEAIKYAQKKLKRSPYSTKYPLSSFVSGDSLPKKKNVVLVLMESMSSYRMTYYKHASGHTPTIDSLAMHSLFYPNTYTAGIHTHNGIFSSIFGLPALGALKTMSSPISSNQKFSGISNILSNEGYKSIYLCSTTQNFDNVGAFLKNNDFDLIIDEDFFDKSDVVDNWGVGDHTLLTTTLPLLDSIVKDSPFFAVYATVSTHTPYAVPKKIAFKPTTKSDVDKIYEYADWSIKQFLDKAKTKEWFDNTIFIFAADHGQTFSRKYEMSLAYHHSPLMFYSPSTIKPTIDTSLAMQIDIPATLMGFLDIPYINNTLGIDLRKAHRPYAYFSADNMKACIDHNYYYFENSSGVEFLYQLKDESTTNLLSSKTSVADSMKYHLHSMLQTTQYMIFNNLNDLNKIQPEKNR